MSYQLSEITHCEKQRNNPNHHSTFQAVEQFTPDMLPEKFKNDEQIAILLQHLKQLTVKIDVQRETDADNITSLHNRKRIGSGIIVNVHDNDVSQEVKILTAKHVLCDPFQEQHSKAIIGFDKEDCEWYSSNGIQIDEFDAEKDWCFFYSKIENGQVYFQDIARNTQELKQLSILRERYAHLRDKDKLCLIFSHPHGCFKQVSMGTLVGYDELNEDHEELEKYDCLKYNTPTCTGSSGAFILALGTDDIHVHSGRMKFDEETFALSSGPIKVEKIHV